MTFLLDTHAFIWMETRPKLLGGGALRTIENSQSTLYLSAASGYEMSFKFGRGRLPIAGPILANLEPALVRLNIVSLKISMRDALSAGALPDVHRDPFDRLLAAQALDRGLIMISADAAFDQLGVPRLW